MDTSILAPLGWGCTVTVKGDVKPLKDAMQSLYGPNKVFLKTYLDHIKVSRLKAWFLLQYCLVLVSEPKLWNGSAHLGKTNIAAVMSWSYFWSNKQVFLCAWQCDTDIYLCWASTDHGGLIILDTDSAIIIGGICANRAQRKSCTFIYRWKWRSRFPLCASERPLNGS